jgi:uncharacterized protein (DUF58 family)
VTDPKPPRRPEVDPDQRRTRELLRRLELDVTRRLDGLLQGDFRGLVPGLGSEPGETRMYTPGDDVRRMDWNVTARMATPHVRESIADRELETTVLVDLSPSLDFGTSLRTKRELAISAVAAVALLTDRVGNRLGAIVVDGNGVTEHRTGSGRRHLMALLHRLHTTESRSGGTDLETGLRRLAAPGRRAGLAVVVSDLLADGWPESLRAVTARHEALVIEVVDPRELELPNVGVIELVDLETGELRELDTRRGSVREKFAAAGRARLDDNSRAVRQAGAEHLVLRTDRDWLVDLAHFVDRRRRGRRLTRPLTRT